MKHPLTNYRWQAIVTNDHRKDGQFFYAVKTTKIFCKPSCHSKLPKRENVLIFTSPTEATAAGFHPCKRCCPTGDKLSNDMWIIQIKQFIEQNYQQPLTLDLIAENCHGSASNLQRTFKRYTGQSPTEYLMEVRLKNSLKLLQATDYTIKSIALYCGFNSDTYFNTKFKSHFQMTPLEYKEFIFKK